MATSYDILPPGWLLEPQLQQQEQIAQELVSDHYMVNMDHFYDARVRAKNNTAITLINLLAMNITRSNTLAPDAEETAKEAFYFAHVTAEIVLSPKAPALAIEDIFSFSGSDTSLGLHLQISGEGYANTHPTLNNFTKKHLDKIDKSGQYSSLARTMAFVTFMAVDAGQCLNYIDEQCRAFSQEIPN